MRTNRLLLAGLLPALLLCGATAAQDVPLDVELGYRWTDVTGNDDRQPAVSSISITFGPWMEALGVFMSPP